MTPSTTVLAVWIMLIVCTCRCTCAPIPAAAQQSAGTQCSPQNRNPCESLPTLCSAGGGRCVSKDPCEYHCLCPDGRLGRDCSRNSNSDPGSVVDTLLIFPKDIFSDANHMSKSEVFANSNRQNSTPTAELNSTTSLSIPTTATWSETTTASQEPTTAAAAGLANNNLPLSSNITSPNPPLSETATTTLSVKTSVKISLTTAIPIHAEATTGSPVSESSTKSTIYPAASNSLREEAWVSSTITAKSTGTSPHTQQSTVTTPRETQAPLSNVSFLLNLSSSPSSYTQRMYANIESSTKPLPVVAGNFSKSSAEQKAGSPQAIDSQRTEISNPSQAETIQRSFKHNVILSQGLGSQSGSPAAKQSQQGTTQKYHSIATTPTTRSTFSSSQYINTSSQQTPTTSASNTAQSTAAIEEFPTLFKLTLDNPLNPIDSGKNSALSMVVHRVFLPIEAFQPALRSAP